MRAYIFVFVLMLVIQYQHSVGQNKKDSSVKEKKETYTDPFRLDYADVFENMNYNQPLRPQVHYTSITGQIADPTGLILIEHSK